MSLPAAKTRIPVVLVSNKRTVKGALWGWHIPIMNGYIAHNTGPDRLRVRVEAGKTYSAYDRDDLPFVDLPETRAQAEADVKDTPEGERHHLRSIVPCVNGMHASWRFIDAMFYTDYSLGHKSFVSRVRLWGSLVEKDTDPGMGGGTFAGRHRKVVACADLPGVALRFWGLLIRAAISCDKNSQYPDRYFANPGSAGLYRYTYLRSAETLFALACIARKGNVREFQQAMNTRKHSLYVEMWPASETAMTWPGVMSAFRIWQSSFRSLYIRRHPDAPTFPREYDMLAARHRAEDRLNRVFESILKRELGCK